MSRKKITISKKKENIPLILPSDNQIMESYIHKNKVRLIESVLSSIEHAVNNNLLFAEVFGFKDSDFIITIFEKDYLININHIYQVCLETENYELCPRVVRLQNLLKNLNEKEIETIGKSE